MSQVKKFYNEYYSEKREFQPSTLIDKLYLLFRRFETHRYERAQQLLEQLQGKILDVGCGDCSFLNYLDNRFQKFGIDVSDARIANNKNANINVVCGDLNEKLPFQDKAFDVITVLSVLEHLFDVHLQIQEYFRVLKAGGTLILEVPNVAFLPNRLRLLFGRVPVTGDWSMAWDDNHLHYFAKKELMNLLKENGFQIQRITGSGVFAALRMWWPAMLCGNLMYECRKS